MSAGGRGTYSIRIDLDASQAIAMTNQLRTQLGSLGASFQTSSGPIGQTAMNLDRYNAAARQSVGASSALGGGFTNVKGALGGLNTQINTTAATLPKMASAQQQAAAASQKSAQAMQSQIQRATALGSRIGGMAFMFTGLTAAMGEAQGMQSLLEESQKKLNDAQIKAERVVKKYGEGSFQATRALEALEKEERAVAFQSRITTLSIQDQFFFIGGLASIALPSVITAFGKLRTAMKTAETTGKSFGAVMSASLAGASGRFTSVINAMTLGLNRLTPSLLQVNTAMGASAVNTARNTTALSTYTVATGAATAGTRTLSVALTGLLRHPVVLVIAALASAFLVLQQNVFGVTDRIREFGIALGQAFPILQPLLNLLDGIAATLGITGEAAVDASERFRTAFEGFGNLSSLWHDTLAGMQRSENEFVRFFGNLGVVISDFVVNAGEQFRLFAESMIVDWNEVIPQIQSTLEGLGAWFSDFFTSLPGTLADISTQMLDALGIFKLADMIQSNPVLRQMGEAVMSFVDFVSDVSQDIIKRLGLDKVAAEIVKVLQGAALVSSGTAPSKNIPETGPGIFGLPEIQQQPFMGQQEEVARQEALRRTIVPEGGGLFRAPQTATQQGFGVRGKPQTIEDLRALGVGQAQFGAGGGGVPLLPTRPPPTGGITPTDLPAAMDAMNAWRRENESIAKESKTWWAQMGAGTKPMQDLEQELRILQDDTGAYNDEAEITPEVAERIKAAQEEYNRVLKDTDDAQKAQEAATQVLNKGYAQTAEEVDKVETVTSKLKDANNELDTAIRQTGQGIQDQSFMLETQRQGTLEAEKAIIDYGSELIKNTAFNKEWGAAIDSNVFRQAAFQTGVQNQVAELNKQKVAVAENAGALSEYARQVASGEQQQVAFVRGQQEQAKSLLDSKVAIAEAVGALGEYKAQIASGEAQQVAFLQGILEQERALLDSKVALAEGAGALAAYFEQIASGEQAAVAFAEGQQKVGRALGDAIVATHEMEGAIQQLDIGLANGVQQQVAFNTGLQEGRLAAREWFLEMQNATGQSEGLMQGMGELATIVGVDVPEAFSQSAERMQEWIGVATGMEPAVSALADRFLELGAGLSDMVENIELDDFAKDVDDAIEDIGESFEEMADDLGLDEDNALIMQMRAKVETEQMTSEFKKIAPLLTNAIQSQDVEGRQAVSEWLKETVEEATEDATPAVQDAGKRLTAAFDNALAAQPGTEAYRTSILNFTDALDGMGLAASEKAELMHELGVATGNAQLETEALATAMGTLEFQTQAASQATADLISNISQVTGLAISDLATRSEGNLQAIQGQIADFEARGGKIAGGKVTQQPIAAPGAVPDLSAVESEIGRIQQMLALLGPATQQAVGEMNTAFSSIAQTWPTIFQSALQPIQQILTMLGPATQQAVGQMSAAFASMDLTGFTTALQPIHQVLTLLGPAAQQAVAQMSEAFSTIDLSGFLAALQPIHQILTLLGPAAQQAVAQMSAAFATLDVSGALAALQPLHQALSLLGPATQQAAQQMSAALATVGGAADQVSQQIINIATQANATAGAVNGATNTMITALQGVQNMATQTAQSFAQIGEAANAAAGVVQSAANQMISALQGVVDAANAVAEAIRGIGSAAQAAESDVNSLSSAIENIPDGDFVIRGRWDIPSPPPGITAAGVGLGFNLSGTVTYTASGGTGGGGGGGGGSPGFGGPSFGGGGEPSLQFGVQGGLGRADQHNIKDFNRLGILAPVLINHPTKLLVGENGPELVSVTPINRNRAGRTGELSPFVDKRSSSPVAPLQGGFGIGGPMSHGGQFEGGTINIAQGTVVFKDSGPIQVNVSQGAAGGGGIGTGLPTTGGGFPTGGQFGFGQQFGGQQGQFNVPGGQVSVMGNAVACVNGQCFGNAAGFGQPLGGQPFQQPTTTQPEQKIFQPIRDELTGMIKPIETLIEWFKFLGLPTGASVPGTGNFTNAGQNMFGTQQGGMGGGMFGGGLGFGGRGATAVAGGGGAFASAGGAVAMAGKGFGGMNMAPQQDPSSWQVVSLDWQGHEIWFVVDSNGNMVNNHAFATQEDAQRFLAFHQATQQPTQQFPGNMQGGGGFGQQQFGNNIDIQGNPALLNTPFFNNFFGGNNPFTQGGQSGQGFNQGFPGGFGGGLPTGGAGGAGCNICGAASNLSGAASDLSGAANTFGGLGQGQGNVFQGPLPAGMTPEQFVQQFMAGGGGAPGMINMTGGQINFDQNQGEMELRTSTGAIAITGPGGAFAQAGRATAGVGMFGAAQPLAETEQQRELEQINQNLQNIGGQIGQQNTEFTQFQQQQQVDFTTGLEGLTNQFQQFPQQIQTAFGTGLGQVFNAPGFTGFGQSFQQFPGGGAVGSGTNDPLGFLNSMLGGFGIPTPAGIPGGGGVPAGGGVGTGGGTGAGGCVNLCAGSLAGLGGGTGGGVGGGMGGGVAPPGQMFGGGGEPSFIGGGGGIGAPAGGGGGGGQGTYPGGNGSGCSCSCMPMDSDPDRYKIEDGQGNDCNNHIYFDTIEECYSRLNEICPGENINGPNNGFLGGGGGAIPTPNVELHDYMPAGNEGTFQRPVNEINLAPGARTGEVNTNPNSWRVIEFSGQDLGCPGCEPGEMPGGSYLVVDNQGNLVTTAAFVSAEDAQRFIDYHRALQNPPQNFGPPPGSGQPGDLSGDMIPGTQFGGGMQQPGFGQPSFGGGGAVAIAGGGGFGGQPTFGQPGSMGPIGNPPVPPQIVQAAGLPSQHPDVNQDPTTWSIVESAGLVGTYDIIDDSGDVVQLGFRTLRDAETYLNYFISYYEWVASGSTGIPGPTPVPGGGVGGGAGGGFPVGGGIGGGFFAGTGGGITATAGNAAAQAGGGGAFAQAGNALAIAGGFGGNLGTGKKLGPTPVPDMPFEEIPRAQGPFRSGQDNQEPIFDNSGIKIGADFGSPGDTVTMENVEEGGGGTDGRGGGGRRSRFRDRLRKHRAAFAAAGNSEALAIIDAFASKMEEMFGNLVMNLTVNSMLDGNLIHRNQQRLALKKVSVFS